MVWGGVAVEMGRSGQVRVLVGCYRKEHEIKDPSVSLVHLGKWWAINQQGNLEEKKKNILFYLEEKK